MMKSKENNLIVSILAPQHTPAHHHLTVHIKPQHSILPKVLNSVKIMIVNKCDNITLRSGACSTLKGYNRYDFQRAILPLDSALTMIKSKHPIGCTKCCIVYELTNSASFTTPLWWEYRVFLAVEVSTNPFSDKNEVTAILFKIKSGAFNIGSKGIYNLHKCILQHSMHRPYSAATWNLGGQALSLESKFMFDVPASVRVVLEQSHLSIEHDPIFYRASTFA
jgi:hypothetical protein